METYTLKTVEQSVLINGSLSSTSYDIPVDSQGKVPDYIDKFRLITNGQMFVFDTEQEYRDWLQNNT
jgi:hypothetical protein